MISYSTQIVICESVREMMRQSLTKNSQLSIELKVSSVPTTDSNLSAVSL